MRILLLTQYYPPEVGAAQIRLSAFARELRETGHEVDVVTALPSYPSGALAPDDRWRLGRRERIDGIPVTRVWLFTATGAGVRRLMSYLSFTATGLVAALRAPRPDVVFVESPPLFLAVTGWVAARRFGAALVLNVSDLWPDSVRDIGAFGRGPWLRLAEGLERWLYRRATAVTAVTEGIRDRLIQVKGVEPEKVLFLPNGADTRTFHPVQRSPDRPRPSRPTFVYAGNHGFAQGLDVLLDAAAIVPDIDFVLVGDGSEKARLIAEASKRGLRNLRFEPTVPPEAIADLYAGATAGIATLRQSDLMKGVRPAKVLAIMACGRAVLYSGAGEGADLVTAAGAGVVVPPEDPMALAEGARELVANPDAALRMGESGRRHVETHLAWPALVGDWLAQLDSLLSRKLRP